MLQLLPLVLLEMPTNEEHRGVSGVAAQHREDGMTTRTTKFHTSLQAPDWHTNIPRTIELGPCQEVTKHTTL
jgi:hypothetical protein